MPRPRVEGARHLRSTAIRRRYGSGSWPGWLGPFGCLGTFPVPTRGRNPPYRFQERTGDGRTAPRVHHTAGRAALRPGGLSAGGERQPPGHVSRRGSAPGRPLTPAERNALHCRSYTHVPVSGFPSGSFPFSTSVRVLRSLENETFPVTVTAPFFLLTTVYWRSPTFVSARVSVVGSPMTT